MEIFSYSFLLVLLFRLNLAENMKLNLGGEWKVKGSYSKIVGFILNLFNREEYEFSGCVPGGIYTDLMYNNIIGDIFYGYGDVNYRWVGSVDWTYTKEFTVDQYLLSSTHVDLVFEGLDTFATILLNGKEVGTSTNMFVRYVFPVKDVLRVNNTIEVRFESAVKKSAQLAIESDYNVPPHCPEKYRQGTCHINKIRKMQASFSWDWAPSFPSVGIWKDVYLEGFNSATIDYIVAFAINQKNGIWKVEISIYLNSGSFQNVQGTLSFALETNADVIADVVKVNHTAKDDGQILIKHTLYVPMDNIHLWWPNGYGEQSLYTIQVQFGGQSEQSIKYTRFGFRTVELIQFSIGEGASFYFQVNGIPIFAKGANVVPLSILPELSHDKEVTNNIFQSVKDANMNMIRVWGGGVYQSDDFYDLSDEFGIMIWQDFMFACALYPKATEFLESVSDEVRHQVKRLSSHPSIVVWSGNNEIEVALVHEWFFINPKIYEDQYFNLFMGTIRKELQNISPSILYLSSSPSNGRLTEQDGCCTSDPQSPFSGDIHSYYYDWDSYGFYDRIYEIPRFASEYGFQSFPEIDTWMTITQNFNDLIPEKGIVNHRQHRSNEDNELWKLMDKHFNHANLFINQTIYYSQIIQAMSIKIETEHYRSFTGIINETDDRGYTMGALFWQLNDVWVAPTWSSIDFNGRWKMLQYFAKDFFASIIITGKIYNNNLQLFAVSDSSESRKSGILSLNIYNWNSFFPVYSFQKSMNIEPGKSTKIVDTTLTKMNKCVIEDKCFFFFYILSTDGTQITPSNFLFPSPLKNCNIQKVNLKIINVVQVETSCFEITIWSDGIALFVWLNSHEVIGRFSENGFLQISNTKLIIFNTTVQITGEDLLQKVTVTYLNQFLA